MQGLFTIIRTIIYVLAEAAFALEQGSQVLLVDEQTNFILLTQVPGDLQEGDRVCIFQASSLNPNCQGVFRFISQKPVVFLPPEILRYFQVDQILEVRKIYFADGKKEGASFVDAKKFGHDFHANSQSKVLTENLQKEKLNQPKVPRGPNPGVSWDSPSLAEGEFPEIQIPKVPKQKFDTKKDTSETTATASAIINAMKDKSKNQFEFADVRKLQTSEKAPEPKPTPVEKAPSLESSNASRVPLHQALDVSVMQTVPVVPTISFRGLRYRTMTLDTLERDSLWEKNKGELKPRIGTGFTLNLMQHMTHIIGFGWRYHDYDVAKSRSTYDDLAPDLEAVTYTKITGGAVHGEYGRRYMPLEWLSVDNLAGLEIWHSEIWLRSYMTDTTKDQSQALAFARSQFFFAAARWHGALKIHARGWGFALGSMVTIPITSFRKTFDGGAVVSERLNYSSESASDLKRSLDHRNSIVGAEIYLGLSYQPQRN